VDSLVPFLRLPSIHHIVNDLIFGPFSKEFFKKWKQSYAKVDDKKKFPIQVSLAKEFSLIKLPELYHDLLQKYNKARCRNCKTVPSKKALCLVCGEICCFNSTCCRGGTGMNDDGECSRVGFFFLFRYFFLFFHLNCVSIRCNVEESEYF
jgi:hypothetical protein